MWRANADGVIVGSAIVDLIGKKQGEKDMVQEVGRLARSLASAIKAK